MNKPLSALAGIAPLGTAGIAGVLAASSGGEEEVALQECSSDPDHHPSIIIIEVHARTEGR